jgi:hypothetical protein
VTIRAVFFVLPELSQNRPTSASRANCEKLVCGRDVEDALELRDFTDSNGHNAQT